MNVSRYQENTLEMDPVVPSHNPLRAAIKTLSALMSERRDYVIGIALLLVVVLFWTSSSFVTQNLYQGGYDKPFMVTYLNTSSFAMYLIPFALKKIFAKSGGGAASISTRNGYQAVAAEPETDDEGRRSPDISLDRNNAHESELPPLTSRETLQLAFVFCFIWIAANWTVNASLDYTSVASATIMASMSGFFTLGIGRIFRVETLTWTKVVAVLVSFSGIIIVSLSDSSNSSTTASSTLKRAVLGDNYSSPLFGDALALSSALLYAFYVILLKARIRSESRINMQMFFGFVGLFNIICCWPIALILHWTGMEKFELPSDNKAVTGILINMFITFSSDFIYVIAMLKTTPLVVTVGLSLTIPVAVVGDLILNKSVHILSVFGALLVVVSFVTVGLEDSKMEEMRPLVLEEEQEGEQVALRLSEDIDERGS